MATMPDVISADLDRDADRRMEALARSIANGKPCNEHGGLSPRAAIVIAGIGLFVWGWSHGSRTPDGRWLVAVAIVGVTLLVLFTFGWRYRRRERLDAAYTKRMESGLQQDTSGDHIWDA